MLLVTVQIQDDEDKAMQNEEEAYIAKTQLNCHSPVVERAVIVSKRIIPRKQTNDDARLT